MTVDRAKSPLFSPDLAFHARVNQPPETTETELLIDLDVWFPSRRLQHLTPPSTPLTAAVRACARSHYHPLRFVTKHLWADPKRSPTSEEIMSALEGRPKSSAPSLANAVERTPPPPETPLAPIGRSRTAGDLRLATPPPSEEIIDLIYKSPRTVPEKSAAAPKPSYESQQESLEDRINRTSATIVLTRTARTKFRKLRRQSKFFCDLCKVPSSSRASRKVHEAGQKHQQNFERKSAGDLRCHLCNKQLRTRA